MTKTFCDLCDRETKTKKYILPSYDVEVTRNINGASLARFIVPVDIEMDICVYCEDKIREFLKRTNFKEDNE